MDFSSNSWPKTEPIPNPPLEDPLIQLRQDIALAQINQMQYQFGPYFGNYMPDAFAPGPVQDGAGNAAQVAVSNQDSQVEMTNAVRRIQDSHLSMTKKIYGLQAARIQAKSMGRHSGEVSLSTGELVVAIIRSVHQNTVCVELLVSRNDKTSIASLEIYMLGQPDLVWKSHTIPPTGSPLDTLRAYVTRKDTMNRVGLTVDSIIIDASHINGFRQSARCFCNESFEIDFNAHGPVRCALHQAASSVAVRLREFVTPHAMLGQPLVLKQVPLNHHSIFQSNIVVDCASLNQWPLRPINAPKKKATKIRAKKNKNKFNVVAPKESQILRRK
ncbi:hypothetical protein CAEBREN_05541 [Caenorhabditis brenneri]|uniref:Uncharacterized protein n=1 Tax=Caenorhabditis brenneri TaxID=135651 RepID=G0N6S4_CAEBE|nr:hypothetical protein CAEBREN_05541 [Caenorhabditis brenneri]